MQVPPSGGASRAERRTTNAERRPTLLSLLDAGNERPDPRDVDLFDRHRLQVRLNQERRQIEVGLEADVERERRDDPLQPRADAALAAEVVEDDDFSAAAADAVHLAR